MRRRLPYALVLSCSIACSGPEGADAGAGAGTDAALLDAARDDAGPPMVEAFAALGANAEGIALGTSAAGAPALYVTTRDGRLARIGADGTVETHATVADPLGVAVRADGDLLVCGKDAGGAAVLFLVTRSGAVSTHVAAGPGGVPFGLTNFVAIAPDDSIVFSDSMANRVFRADADGSNVALVTDAITYPNGLAFAPDGATLFVASWDDETVHALAFDRASGTYGAPSPSIEGVANVDGVVAATDGTLVLVTSSRGILTATPGSDETATLAPTRAITLPANGIFGDEAFGATDLFIASLGQPDVIRVRTSLRGVALPVR